jgi:hypothetical protein
MEAGSVSRGPWPTPWRVGLRLGRRDQVRRLAGGGGGYDHGAAVGLEGPDPAGEVGGGALQGGVS